jgi:hypothetical protein
LQLLHNYNPELLCPNLELVFEFHLFHVVSWLKFRAGFSRWLLCFVSFSSFHVQTENMEAFFNLSFFFLGAHSSISF